MNEHKKKYGIFMMKPATLLTNSSWEKMAEVEYKDIDWRYNLIRSSYPGKIFKVEELPEATEFTSAPEDKKVEGKTFLGMISELKKAQPKVLPDNIPFILDIIPGLLPSEFLDKKNEEGFAKIIKSLKELSETVNPDRNEEFKGFNIGEIFSNPSKLWDVNNPENPFRLAVDKDEETDPSKLTINVRKVRQPEPESLDELSPEEKKEQKAIEEMMKWDKERLAKHGRTWENQARKHSQRAYKFEQQNALLLEKMEEMFQELKTYRMDEFEEHVENELRATYFVEPAEDNE